MEANAPTTCSDTLRAGLPHGEREEAVLGLEEVLCPTPPDGDTSNERGPTSAQEVVHVHGEMRPGEGAEPEMGDAPAAADRS